MDKTKKIFELNLHEEVGGHSSIFADFEGEDEGLCIGTIWNEDIEAEELAKELINRYNHHDKLVEALRRAWSLLDGLLGCPNPHEEMESRGEQCQICAEYDYIEAVLTEIEQEQGGTRKEK